MTKIFFDVLWFVPGLALALPLGLLTMRHLRRSKHGGAVAFASALLLSFDIVNPRNHDIIQEAANETKRKKDSQSGDPPDTGEKTAS
jgi:hypothetical protein